MAHRWDVPVDGSMTEVIRNGNLEVVGYREVSGSREILRDKRGYLLGIFDRHTKVTRDWFGKVVGYYVNQLMSLL